MQLVLKHMRKHLLGYCIATLAMLAAIALDMLNPLLVRVIIDDIIKAGHVELLTRTLLALLGVTLGRGILGYLREFLFDKTGSSVAMDLRKEVFHHVNSLSLSFFDTRNTRGAHGPDQGGCGQHLGFMWILYPISDRPDRILRHVRCHSLHLKLEAGLIMPGGYAADFPVGYDHGEKIR